jgi:hypothetical protein
MGSFLHLLTSLLVANWGSYQNGDILPHFDCPYYAPAYVRISTYVILYISSKDLLLFVESLLL